jgi:biotin carboxyl carrier protein
LKLRVDVDGQTRLIDPQATTASIEQVMPGVYSVLLNGRSFQIHLAKQSTKDHAKDLASFEVWVGLRRHIITVADPRDRVSNADKAGANGPVEIRAQMPGKIIQLLAEAGSAVTSGQGLMVVEAMKMQNEVKAPKDGTLTRIHVTQGATVSAGDLLLVVE